MPQYKLQYFATPGIGEAIRFILKYADQEFEDIRYDINVWPKIKPTTPYGVLPVLEIDGEPHHQSLALCRYLAKEYNLAGKDRLEDLRIDSMVETINDYRIVFTQVLWAPDEKEKAKKKELLVNESMPFYLTRFEKQVKKNGGYFIGGRVTWVDIFFASLKPYLDFVAGFDTLKDSAILKELVDKIHAIPNIKKWISERPTECCLQEYFRGK